MFETAGLPSVEYFNLTWWHRCGSSRLPDGITLYFSPLCGFFGQIRIFQLCVDVFGEDMFKSLSTVIVAATVAFCAVRQTPKFGGGRRSVRNVARPRTNRPHGRQLPPPASAAPAAPAAAGATSAATAAAPPMPDGRGMAGPAGWHRCRHRSSVICSRRWAPAASSRFAADRQHRRRWR